LDTSYCLLGQQTLEITCFKYNKSVDTPAQSATNSSCLVLSKDMSLAVSKLKDKDGLYNNFVFNTDGLENPAPNPNDKDYNE
jgi:hypothetical protein